MNPPLPRNDGTLSYRVGQLEKAIEHLDADLDRRIGALDGQFKRTIERFEEKQDRRFLSMEGQMRKLMWMIVTSSISLTTALLALALALATR